MTTRRRQNAEKNGRLAEKLVAIRLRFKCWYLLKSRYRCPYGEIDLIMQKPEKLLFVEVKFTNQTKDDALEQILPSLRQRRRIYNSANYFLSEQPDMKEYEMGFVVALVRPYARIQFIDDHFFDMM
jgi:putative endonuclease